MNSKSIAEHVADGDRRGAVLAVALKAAELADRTESARDFRPLATTVLECCDRLAELEPSPETDRAQVLRLVIEDRQRKHSQAATS